MLDRFTKYIDSHRNPQFIVGVFIACWLLLNILQAAFTELANDEAYYWMYSRNLSWGYFDHPPLIALLVKLGFSLFKNELGVRLLPLILGTGTVYIVYRIIREEITSLSLLFFLMCSLLIFQSHIGGFLAIPDIPVVFFSALFFLVYRTFVYNDTLKLALVLGVIGAAMLYSKYHGILVLFFTLLSNLSLLKRRSFWIIPITILVLLIPHLMWQYTNNFPTLEYHLVSRSSNYKFDHTFNYIYSQLLISGPFIGIILLYHATVYKTGSNVFEKALKFNFIGFIVFFFVSSLKGHVEPHWTAIAYIPALLLTYQGIKENEKVKRWIKILFVPSFILFIFIRLCLFFTILPSSWKLGAEFHHWDTWAKEIKTASNGKRVVFVNSFQRPSKYAFYSGGDFAHTLNSIYYRKNQYDLWNFEDSIQCRPVFLVGSNRKLDSLVTVIDTYRIEEFNSFHSYYNVEINTFPKKVQVKPGGEVNLNLEILNTSGDTLFFLSSSEDFPPELVMVKHNGKKFSRRVVVQRIQEPIVPGGKKSIPVSFISPDGEGTYTYYFAIVNDYLYPSCSAATVQVLVKN
jgi:hypothetical protein